jgi:formate dehydrogenase subunit gamma
VNPEVAAVVAEALHRHQHEPGPLLEILHQVQNVLGCVPATAVPLIASGLNLSRADVHGVLSFYHHFRERPVGRLHLQLCRAEACLAMNGEEHAQYARRRMGVDFGETKADGSVTLDAVYCLGLCPCAPAALINGEPVGRVDALTIDSLAERHEIS